MYARRHLALILMSALTLALLAVVAAPASSALATDLMTRQITTNAFDDINPSIDDGRLVWQSWDGGDWDIEIMDLVTGRSWPITTSGFGVNDERPVVSGSSVVFGTRDRSDPTTWTIQLYDINFDETWQIATVSDGGYDGWQPGVAWWGIEGGERYVYTWTYPDIVTRLSGPGAWSPVVGGSSICWIEPGGVFVYDQNNATTHRLEALGVTPPDELAIEGSALLATWNGVEGRDGHLMTYDLVTGAFQTIPVGASLYQVPVLSEGRVAWIDEDGVWTARICDGAAEREADSPGGSYAGYRQLCLSGDSLVWTVQGNDPSTWQIYRRDLATGVTTCLSAGVQGGHNQMPSVWGDLVAWEGREGNDGDIFLASPGSFSDIACSTYRYAAESLLRDGIVGGYPDGSFRPQAPVLRAQFAKMVIGALDIPVSEGTHPLPFTDVDVDPGSLYPDDYVAAAAALGITKGITPTSFAPYRSISRLQMVTMVVRAARAQGIELTEPLADYEGWVTDPTHGPNFRLAMHNGLLEGIDFWQERDELETYVWDPWAEATRGEVAQVLWNLRDRPIAGLGAAELPSGLESWLRRRGFLGTAWTLNSLPAGWFVCSDPVLLNRGNIDFYDSPHNPALSQYGAKRGYSLDLTTGGASDEGFFLVARVSREELTRLEQGRPTGVFIEGQEWRAGRGESHWYSFVVLPLPEDPDHFCLLTMNLPVGRMDTDEERIPLLQDFSNRLVRLVPVAGPLE